MNRKKAAADFPMITIVMFVLGIVVVILLFTKGFSLLSPQGKAEASTLKALDDIIVKMGTNAFEAGQPVIAYGYVDKDAAIIGFNSNEAKTGDINRPKQCGSRSNSCICAINGKDKVLECKGFTGEEISGFKWSGEGLKIKNGNVQIEGPIKSGSFVILGRNGGAFTLTMTLSGTTVSFGGDINYEQDVRLA